jgi:hypothetical protein
MKEAANSGGLLFAFDLRRALGVLGGQFAQLRLCLNIAQRDGVPQALGGLISQIDGAFGHRPVWHIDPRSEFNIAHDGN